MAHLLPLLPLLAFLLLQLSSGLDSRARHHRSLLNTFPFNTQQDDGGGHHAANHQQHEAAPRTSLTSRGSKQVRECLVDVQ